MQLLSPAFEDGQTIPTRYTEDGANVSPPLVWSDPPERAVEFALIMEDPDAPQEEPWVHWVLYAISGHATQLLEGSSASGTLKAPHGTRQGETSWGPGNIGYRGPAPPPGHGNHRYRFTLYALDQPLDLANSIEKGALLKAIEHRTLATAELIGTYQR